MNEKNIYNYTRIEQAINYIQENFRNQPTLEEIAGNIHLSPYHFQRLFSEWAGTSPKKFLQYISLEYAKKILKDNRATLFDAAMETGLSGTGRLHDLFVNIQGMTPAEYKNGGEKLSINYSFANSPFGNILAASTSKGICHLSFYTNQDDVLSALKNEFPHAEYKQYTDSIQQNALYIFNFERKKLNEIKLHLKGTKFQLKVWESLLKIPVGRLSTYGNIAKEIKQPNASRGVGSAIGKNPVAYLIPCHRVIKSSGILSGYRWGTARKAAIIGWEAARIYG
jgi:AraC family transcriptional regulator, regulatory protein of adaptative response / methylated-DNA-[protein]-cysteine methyltransferase